MSYRAHYMATNTDSLAGEVGAYLGWRRLTLALALLWLPAWYLRPETPTEVAAWGLGLAVALVVTLLVLAAASLVVR